MVRRVRMSLMRVRVAIAVHAVGVLLASNARGQSLLIRGGTLIDGTGRQPIENATILIRDGVFAEIIPQAAAPTGNIETIDARGKFLIPGLVDSHIHYRDWETELFLAHGVTSVNDIGNPYYWQRALKTGFNTGRIRGPRFFFGGEVTLPSEEAAQSQRPTIQRRGPSVTGRGFTPASVTRLDGHVVDTRWVSATELSVTLTAQQTTRAGTFLLTVETPKPGGGVSHPIEFLVVFKQER